MPYNSDSPLILGLNAFFASPKANAGTIGSSLLREIAKDKDGNAIIDPLTGKPEFKYSLSDRASQYMSIAPTQGEVDHIDGWPVDDQDLVRSYMIQAIDDDIPMSFHWEHVDSAGDTRAVVVSWDQGFGVTFRSPYY